MVELEEESLDEVEETEEIDEVKVATGWTLWAEGIVAEFGVIVGEDSGEILGDVRVAEEEGGARGAFTVLVEDGFEGGGRYENMELGCWGSSRGREVVAWGGTGAWVSWGEGNGRSWDGLEGA